MKLLYLLSVLSIYNTNAFHYPNMLPQFSYQIGKVQELKDKPIKIVIDNNYLCLFKDQKTGQIKLVNDYCAHRGASLSKTGTLEDSGIRCGYHGLCFHKSKNPDLTPNLKIINDNIYLSPIIDHEEIFFPPEEFDKNFRAIEGSCKINTNINIFLENVIDNTHISELHSFGTRNQLPENLKYERLSDFGFRQTFDYKPGELSLSNQIQKIKKKQNMLNVENEYHLPSNVLSRVKVDDRDIKTVFVRAFPINKKETIIFWKIYRNFLVFDFEPLNILGDILFRVLFEYTLSEDINLLKNVYIDQDQNKQFHTKFDIIQKEFRGDLQKYMIKGIVRENLKTTKKKCNKCSETKLEEIKDSNPFIDELF